MKTITLWLSGLTALFLFSCTKDVDDVTFSPDYSTTSRINPNNQKPGPGLTSEFSESPAKVNDDVYLNINTAATCGMIQLFRAVDANGEFTTVEDAIDWVKVGDNLDVNGSTLSVPVPTSDEGTWGYEVRFIASGGPGGNCPYNKQEVQLNLTVIAACQGPALTGELVSTQDKGNNMYEFTVTYTVEACANTYTDGKLQGGLTAFVGQPTLSSSNGAVTETRDLNNNYVVIFKNNEVTGTNTYTVVFTKIVTGASGTNQLTGDWSFSANDADGNPVRLEFAKIYF